MSDGLAMFKSLSRMIKSNCKSLKENQSVLFVKKICFLTWCLDRSDRQWSVSVQVILAVEFQENKIIHRRSDEKQKFIELECETKRLSDDDVESDLSSILRRYSL